MPLIAYDEAGNVLATLDLLVIRGATEAVNFQAHEDSGGQHTDFWRVDGAKGSKHWPGQLDSPHDFRVDLAGESGRKRIAAVYRKPTDETNRPARPYRSDAR